MFLFKEASFTLVLHQCLFSARSTKALPAKLPAAFLASLLEQTWRASLSHSVSFLNTVSQCVWAFVWGTWAMCHTPSSGPSVVSATLVSSIGEDITDQLVLLLYSSHVCCGGFLSPNFTFLKVSSDFPPKHGILFTKVFKPFFFFLSMIFLQS